MSLVIGKKCTAWFSKERISKNDIPGGLKRSSSRLDSGTFAVMLNCVLPLIALGVLAPVQVSEAEISKTIGTLRSTPDDKRAELTLKLALDIRKLPAGTSKAQLASSLANLATEGDFGFKTLQEVSNTLSSALKETSLPNDQAGEPNYAYTQLAQLARYESMKVDLKSPEYNRAMSVLVKQDEARAKVDFTLNDITGMSWTLSKLKGKVVVVNFWATWCPPCRKEMPDLQALSQEYKDKGLVVLAISDETMDKVQPFIAQNKYTFPVLLDTGRKVNTSYFVNGIPKNFVYNREGKLVAQSIDMRTRGQFMKMLAKAGLK